LEKRRGNFGTHLERVTATAIERADKNDDLDGAHRAVENAAALERAEELRRDAIAAPKDTKAAEEEIEDAGAALLIARLLDEGAAVQRQREVELADAEARREALDQGVSTEDATAAFLVAQSLGADAQEVQELANAAADRRADHKAQIRDAGTRRIDHGRVKRVDGETVRKQQAYSSLTRMKNQLRGDTDEEWRASPDTHHSLDTHNSWVADGRRRQLDYGRDYRADVVRQLRRMGITSLGDVKEIVEGGSIVGFKVEERLLPSWEGVENPVTTFEKATANAARIRREMPEAPRRRSEITEEREKAGKPHHCYPQRSGKWNVGFSVNGQPRQICDPKTGKHLLEKDAAIKLRDRYLEHGGPLCSCGRTCPWLLLPPSKRDDDEGFYLPRRDVEGVYYDSKRKAPKENSAAKKRKKEEPPNLQQLVGCRTKDAILVARIDPDTKRLLPLLTGEWPTTRNRLPARFLGHADGYDASKIFFEPKKDGPDASVWPGGTDGPWALRSLAGPEERGRSIKATGPWMYFRKITKAEEQELKRVLFPDAA